MMRTVLATLLLPLASILAGFSPFQAEHPVVQQGNRALDAGDPETALQHYGRAETELGGRAEIDYDRGNALYRLQRFEEARDAYRKALAGPEGLRPRDAYNLGNTLAHLGATDEAIDAFRKALAADPGNENARYNLEVMLRRKQAGQNGAPQDEKKPSPDRPDGGTRDAGAAEEKDAGRSGAEDGGAGETGNRDGGRNDRSDAGRAQERDAGADSRDGGARADERDAGTPAGSARNRDAGAAAQAGSSRDGGSGPEQAAHEISRQDAEKLLDALRAREQRMPMAPARSSKARSSSDAEKDW